MCRFTRQQARHMFKKHVDTTLLRGRREGFCSFTCRREKGKKGQKCIFVAGARTYGYLVTSSKEVVLQILVIVSPRSPSAPTHYVVVDGTVGGSARNVNPQGHTMSPTSQPTVTTAAC